MEGRRVWRGERGRDFGKEWGLADVGWVKGALEFREKRCDMVLDDLEICYNY